MDAAVQVQQVQHAGDQNVAREASGYGRVGLDAGHVRSLETLFWCAHAVLKQRLQAGVTLPVDSSTYVTQLVDEFVDGMASMAQMLGAMHAMLQTPAMAALLTSGDDGPMSPTTASPGPASAAAAALSAPAVLPPSAAVPAAGAEQPVVPAPVAPDPAAAQLLAGTAAAASSAGQALLEAMQNVSGTFASQAAAGQALPMVAPDDPVFRGWILLADAATLQHLVQLFCPLVWQVLLDQPAHMHSLAIEPDVDALPPCPIHPDRVTELTALLADMSGQQEVHGLLLTMSGHHELVSALGPVGLRKELLQAAGAASSDGTCLKGWYSRARRMFLQG